MARPRDPHAHAIHAPGARLLAAVPLRFFRRRRPRPGGIASIQMVPLVDCLVVIVLFLLQTFESAAA